MLDLCCVLLGSREIHAETSIILRELSIEHDWELREV